MLQNFGTVSLQIIVLLILMLLGILCRKVNFLNKDTVKKLADIMLYIVTPCVIVKSFQRPFDTALLRGFLISGAAAIGSQVMAIILAVLLFRGKDLQRQKVLRFGTVFSNCGFMSIPLLEAILGEEGVFYGAAYLAVFNILAWTVGVVFMSSSGKGSIKAKTILLHPGILSVVLGLIFFFFSVKLPQILYKPIEYMSFLNTPVPMLVIGYYIAEVKIKTVLRHFDEWLLYFLRLIVLPLGLLGVMVLFGIRGNVLVASVISASAPVATMSTMFAAKYDADAVFSAQTVSVSTLMSLVTMTLTVGLAMYLQ